MNSYTSGLGSVDGATRSVSLGGWMWLPMTGLLSFRHSSDYLMTSRLTVIGWSGAMMAVKWC